MNGVNPLSLDKIKVWTDEIAQHRQEISRLTAKRDQMLAEQGMELNLDALKSGPGAAVQDRLAELNAMKAREEELANALASAHLATQTAQNAFNAALENYSATIDQFLKDHPYANLSCLPPLHKTQLEDAQTTVIRKNNEFANAIATWKSLKDPLRDALNALNQAKSTLKEEARTNSVQPRTEETARTCLQVYADLEARSAAAREAVGQAKVGLKAAAIVRKALEKEIVVSQKISYVQSTHARDTANRAIDAEIKAHAKAIKALEKQIAMAQKAIPI